MIKTIGLLMFVLLLMVSCENREVSETVTVESTEMESGLRHVVLFKFKEGTSEETIKEVEEAFEKLPSKIPEIKDFEWSNKNVSPEGFGQGFTHCYFLTFENEEGRDIYLPHPDHKAFGGIVGPHLAEGGVLVYDYTF